MFHLFLIGTYLFVGVSVTGLSVAASTRGWGVDQPIVVEEVTVEATDDHEVTVEHKTKEHSDTHVHRTFYGGFYYPFYRSHGMRHVKIKIRGGGFHGGK